MIYETDSGKCVDFLSAIIMEKGEYGMTPKITAWAAG